MRRLYVLHQMTKVEWEASVATSWTGPALYNPDVACTRLRCLEYHIIKIFLRAVVNSVSNSAWVFGDPGL